MGYSRNEARAIARWVGDHLVVSRRLRAKRPPDGLTKRTHRELSRAFVEGGRRRIFDMLMSGDASVHGREERIRFDRVRRALRLHEDRIRRKPNVIGTAVGRRRRRGRSLPTPCLTVLVARKIATAIGSVMPVEVSDAPSSALALSISGSVASEDCVLIATACAGATARAKRRMQTRPPIAATG